jgi:RNA polymerase sigma factor (sigma-70 family)
MVERTGTEPERFETIEAAFEALESPLLQYARRLLGSDVMAEDVLQEAFLKLHASFGEVREPRAWLYRTVHNLSLNQLRRAGRQRVVVDGEGEGGVMGMAEWADPQPLPDERIAREEGIGQVRLGLATLDERSRELLRLKFEEELSYKEIGERTGLTVGHVGYLLHHAIKALAAELGKTGVIR